jgi:hypothetical protein
VVRLHQSLAVATAVQQTMWPSVALHSEQHTREYGCHKSPSVVRPAVAVVVAAVPGTTLNRLPSLGATPAGKTLPSNANNLMSWLQGIPLAASAARSPYRSDHLQPARLLDV